MTGVMCGDAWNELEPLPSFHINLDTQLVELFLADGRRRLAHHIATRVVLRESNEVANRVGTGKDRAQAVEAEGQTGVWRCAVGEGIHQEAELGSGALVGEAEGVEHLVLQHAVMDTDGAATHFMPFMTMSYALARMSPQRLGSSSKASSSGLGAVKGWCMA